MFARFVGRIQILKHHHRLDANLSKDMADQHGNVVHVLHVQAVSDVLRGHGRLVEFRVLDKGGICAT